MVGTSVVESARDSLYVPDRPDDARRFPLGAPRRSYAFPLGSPPNILTAPFSPNAVLVAFMNSSADQSTPRPADAMVLAGPARRLREIFPLERANRE